MKRCTIATVLALDIFASSIWGHAADSQDPHHLGAALRSTGDAARPARDLRHAHDEQNGGDANDADDGTKHGQH